VRQPASLLGASGKAVWGAGISGRSSAEYGEDPPWLLLTTVGTLYLAITIGYTPPELEPLTTFGTFVLINRHSIASAVLRESSLSS